MMMRKFVRYANLSVTWFILIGHQATSDWHSHFIWTKGREELCLFLLSWFLLRVCIFINVRFLLIFKFNFYIYIDSDAQRAKEGLIAEGYRVNFANAKRTDNSSEDTGYQKRSSFRTQQNTADGSENGCEADSSTDNR